MHMVTSNHVYADNMQMNSLYVHGEHDDVKTGMG
jgi:hypothetical protein